MRILVVEDKRKLADTVAQGLRDAGFAVDVAYDGGAGSEMAAVNEYDVIVLDRDLPVLHGDDLCRELSGGSARILMLTAASGLESRVEGLDLGADDYLGKPFAFTELLARLRALGRRSQPALPPVLRSGELVLDPARRHVTRGGHQVHLTNKEFGVLQALMAANGAVLSAEVLEHVWDEHADPFTNTVRVTIVSLRRKLGAPPLIETVRGAGYRV